MKVIKYEVKISDGILDWTHGFSYNITEYWIPKYKIVFNLHQGKPNIFEEDEPRDPINPQEIDVDQYIINLVLTFNESRKALLPALEELYHSSPTSAKRKDK